MRDSRLPARPAGLQKIPPHLFNRWFWLSVSMNLLGLAANGYSAWDNLAQRSIEPWREALGFANCLGLAIVLWSLYRVLNTCLDGWQEWVALRREHENLFDEMDKLMLVVLDVPEVERRNELLGKLGELGERAGQLKRQVEGT